MERLNAAFQAASQDMYSGGTGDGGPTGGNAGGNAQSTADTEVTDVDFEEVK
jgi:molecular chaperone DnaK